MSGYHRSTSKQKSYHFFRAYNQQFLQRPPASRYYIVKASVLGSP